jgi:hypothetical protein
LRLAFCAPLDWHDACERYLVPLRVLTKLEFAVRAKRHIICKRHDPLEWIRRKMKYAKSTKRAVGWNVALDDLVRQPSAHLLGERF